jgi:hypothetical protein
LGGAWGFAPPAPYIIIILPGGLFSKTNTTQKTYTRLLRLTQIDKFWASSFHTSFASQNVKNCLAEHYNFLFNNP